MKYFAVFVIKPFPPIKRKVSQGFLALYENWRTVLNENGYAKTFKFKLAKIKKNKKSMIGYYRLIDVQN